MGIKLTGDALYVDHHSRPTDADRHRFAALGCAVAAVFLFLQRFWRAGLTAGSIRL